MNKDVPNGKVLTCANKMVLVHTYSKIDVNGKIKPVQH